MPTESLSRAPLARPSTARAPQGPRASARAGEASPLAPEPSASVAPPIDAPSREPSTLAGELELLERARRSLADDPHGALEALGLHVARYPSGILAVERDLMTLDALRRVGRKDEARRRAAAWLTRDPSGLHAARVRALLGALDEPRP